MIGCPRVCHPLLSSIIACHAWAFLLTIFFCSVINFLKPNKNSEQENNEEVHLDPFIAELQAKYKPTLHRIDNSTFVTREGYKYTVNDTNHYFTEPLGKRLLILDADSRLETEPGHMLAPPPLTHEDIKRGTAGMMNHFLYGTFTSPNLNCWQYLADSFVPINCSHPILTNT